MNDFHRGLERYLTEEELRRLRAVTLGIAGLGGLGSNACLILARTGIEHFVLVDCDTVDASNLNRQHYFPNHIGQKKTEALKDILLSLNPAISTELSTERITEANVHSLLPRADLWIEALDGATDKAMLVDAALAAKRPLVCASGICGYGGPILTKKTIGNVTIVGDGKSDCAFLPPLAPRVVWAAAMLADSVLEYLLR